MPNHKEPWYEVADAENPALSRIPFLMGDKSISDDVVDKRMEKKLEAVDLPYGSPEYMIKRFKDGGYTNNAALGIMGNLMVESKLDPAIKQIGGGPGRGLAQWGKRGRFDTDQINLVKFAKQKGKPWEDLDVQLDFIMHEMNVHPEYKKVKDKINNAKTVSEATTIFLEDYEKAKEDKSHKGRRIKAAEDFGALIESIPGFNE